MSFAELKPIIFYDIPCMTPGRPWSPNTMKTRYAFTFSAVVAKVLPITNSLVRYCLGYKQLPFTTVWVELPDIARLLQSKGITQPPYTLPAIEDPNTGAFIVDSLAIATYLDDAYPKTPKVLGPAARAALDGALDVFSFGSGGGAGTGAGSDLAPRLVFLILASERLNPVSRTYYDQTRAARLGEAWRTLRDACAAGPEERAERVKQGVETIRGVWHKLTVMYEREGDAESFMLGEEPCFLDFAIAGRIKFILDGLIPSEVEAVTNLEGGRLARLVESLERYYSY